MSDPFEDAIKRKAEELKEEICGHLELHRTEIVMLTKMDSENNLCHLMICYNSRSLKTLTPAVRDQMNLALQEKKATINRRNPEVAPYWHANVQAAMDDKKPQRTGTYCIVELQMVADSEDIKPTTNAVGAVLKSWFHQTDYITSKYLRQHWAKNLYRRYNTFSDTLSHLFLIIKRWVFSVDNIIVYALEDAWVGYNKEANKKMRSYHLKQAAKEDPSTWTKSVKAKIYPGSVEEPLVTPESRRQNIIEFGYYGGGGFFNAGKFSAIKDNKKIKRVLRVVQPKITPEIKLCMRPLDVTLKVHVDGDPKGPFDVKCTPVSLTSSVNQVLARMRQYAQADEAAPCKLLVNSEQIAIESESVALRTMMHTDAIKKALAEAQKTGKVVEFFTTPLRVAISTAAWTEGAVAITDPIDDPPPVLGIRQLRDNIKARVKTMYPLGYHEQRIAARDPEFLLDLIVHRASEKQTSMIDAMYEMLDAKTITASGIARLLDRLASAELAAGPTGAAAPTEPRYPFRRRQYRPSSSDRTRGATAAFIDLCV